MNEAEARASTVQSRAGRLAANGRPCLRSTGSACKGVAITRGGRASSPSTTRGRSARSCRRTRGSLGDVTGAGDSLRLRLPVCAQLRGSASARRCGTAWPQLRRSPCARRWRSPRKSEPRLRARHAHLVPGGRNAWHEPCCRPPASCLAERPEDRNDDQTRLPLLPIAYSRRGRRRQRPRRCRLWRWNRPSSPMACPIRVTSKWRAASRRSSARKAPYRRRSRSSRACCISASNAAELETLAQAAGVMKVSRADLAFAIAERRTGATTVAATMIAAAARRHPRVCHRRHRRRAPQGAKRASTSPPTSSELGAHRRHRRLRRRQGDPRHSEDARSAGNPGRAGRHL